MASKLGAIVVAVAIAICSATLSPTGVRAENGQIAAGVVGGLIGGALLGSALASRPPPPPVYYEAAPVYVEEPICRQVRQRYWDGFGWLYRWVEVCN
jgi:hypothetical protein